MRMRPGNRDRKWNLKKRCPEGLNGQRGFGGPEKGSLNGKRNEAEMKIERRLLQCTLISTIIV